MLESLITLDQKVNTYYLWEAFVDFDFILLEFFQHQNCNLTQLFDCPLEKWGYPFRETTLLMVAIHQYYFAFYQINSLLSRHLHFEVLVGFIFSVKVPCHFSYFNEYACLFTPFEFKVEDPKCLT